jgi:hypothetical protein
VSSVMAAWRWPRELGFRATAGKARPSRVLERSSGYLGRVRVTSLSRQQAGQQCRRRRTACSRAREGSDPGGGFIGQDRHKQLRPSIVPTGTTTWAPRRLATCAGLRPVADSGVRACARLPRVAGLGVGGVSHP